MLYIQHGIVVGFFAVLHCWLNAWAEMLRFGDRMFYKDWWNSVTFSGYYRNWNLVVHDWLFSYVYQDTFMVCKATTTILVCALIFVIELD